MSDKDYRNSGYINIAWNADDGIWQVGGNFTDANNRQFDLGFFKVGPQTLIEAIALCAKQLGPTMNGKGIPRKERNR